MTQLLDTVRQNVASLDAERLRTMVLQLVSKLVETVLQRRKEAQEMAILMARIRQMQDQITLLRQQLVTTAPPIFDMTSSAIDTTTATVTMETTTSIVDVVTPTIQQLNDTTAAPTTTIIATTTSAANIAPSQTDPVQPDAGANSGPTGNIEGGGGPAPTTPTPTNAAPLPTALGA